MMPVALSWSGGKDSTMALRELQRAGDTHVAVLLTSVTDAHQRISIHGVRRKLLAGQASALGIPLREVVLPPDATNAQYEQVMAPALGELRAAGIGRIAFGDLFLRDIRAYRERQVAAVGMEPLFPIWGRDTAALAREFIGLGFRAHVVCVDTVQLAAEFVGRAFDESLLRDLPPGVDPCGENGEFHTFVVDGPAFTEPVRCHLGRTHREPSGRFVFQDLVPG